MNAVADREEARFRAIEKLLDDDLGAGGTEAALAERGVDRLVRLRNGRGDDDALAGREPIGLDHHWGAAFDDIGFRCGGIGEPAVGGGWDALAGTEILHEGFRAFESGGGGGRAESGDPLAFERVDEAGDERRLRPDD